MIEAIDLVGLARSGCRRVVHCCVRLHVGLWRGGRGEVWRGGRVERDRVVTLGRSRAGRRGRCEFRRGAEGGPRRGGRAGERVGGRDRGSVRLVSLCHQLTFIVPRQSCSAACGSARARVGSSRSSSDSQHGTRDEIGRAMRNEVGEIKLLRPTSDHRDFVWSEKRKNSKSRARSAPLLIPNRHSRSSPLENRTRPSNRQNRLGHGKIRDKKLEPSFSATALTVLGADNQQRPIKLRRDCTFHLNRRRRTPSPGCEFHRSTTPARCARLHLSRNPSRTQRLASRANELSLNSRSATSCSPSTPFGTSPWIRSGV